MANTKKECKYCNEFVLVDSGVQTPGGFFCCIDHAIAFANEKTVKKRKKVQRTKDNQKREELKTYGKLQDEAAKAAQFYARMRDHGNPCISCGKHKRVKVCGSVYDGGHYRSKGSAKHLSLYTLNIHLQCVRCNRFEGGNSDYRINLVKKLGVEKVEAIESDQRPRKYSREDLVRIKKIFNKKARRINNRRGVE